MLKKVALIFGVVFIALGLLGFVPGVTTDGEDGTKLLFGLFMVDALHNFIHIASGVVGLLAASSERYAKWYLQIFGLVYAVIAVAGLIQGDTVLGFLHVNMADNLLHVVLAVGLLGAGFGLKENPTGGLTDAKPTNPMNPAM